jgi:hypothetical protein
MPELIVSVSPDNIEKVVIPIGYPRVERLVLLEIVPRIAIVPVLVNVPIPEYVAVEKM